MCSRQNYQDPWYQSFSIAVFCLRCYTQPKRGLERRKVVIWLYGISTLVGYLIPTPVHPHTHTHKYISERERERERESTKKEEKTLVTIQWVMEYLYVEWRTWSSLFHKQSPQRNDFFFYLIWCEVGQTYTQQLVLLGCFVRWEVSGRSVVV